MVTEKKKKNSATLLNGTVRLDVSSWGKWFVFILLILRAIYVVLSRRASLMLG